MTGTGTFGSRLERKIAQYGPLCVGIDPHAYLLSQWGLPHTAAGAREFSLRVLDAATDQVAAIKPQVAFYERFGAAGYSVVEELFVEARQRDVIVIADVKRGDVGTSVDAYADAWLTPGSPLEADAMTLSAFQGFDSLAGPLNHVVNNGKGLFILAATSNPEARVIQTARVIGEEDEQRVSVSAHLLEKVDGWNASHSTGAAGSVGVVLGATLRLSDYGIDIFRTREPSLPVLAPGFGHQGAQLTEARAIFGNLLPSTLISESRSVLSSGLEGIVDAVRQRSDQVRREVVGTP
ncbi:orotidine-5'-phosphate decarboxylase [Lysinibacter sp. HNR]|uniref:orotidine-5'-phosphate decarboxylase n=1 Tax=Lysinibacter sp. HNR TaxID=3031408 RepID=UPI0024356E8B|nr:orotidine-5'-phosphate decarboxylase [Lysinibacter sp. HNR]WGD36282.1 orotidine-5'-phosphate decarboxylase [Lysinibacter sp. HNR]